MAGGAQLSVPDMRRAARHPVDFPVIGEHRALGDVKLHICNLSAHGFMIETPGNGAPSGRLVARSGRAGSSTRMIPARRSAASTTRSAPASAPVCVAAAFAASA